jgi:hypothetical protein
MKDDAVDPIWQLAESAVREAFLLRSFVTYLDEWADPPEKKMARIAQWRQEIGLQMGNPSVTDEATGLFQKLRDAPPEVRTRLVRKWLADTDALYLGRL